MIEYELSDLFMQDSTEINLIVQCSDGMLIDNGNLRSKFTLTESICSEKELRFGRCEASEFKVTTADVVTPFKGKTIDVSMVLDGHTDKPFKLGRYKIVSDNTNPARTSKEIVAYDAMYDVIHANVVNWYNSLLPNADSTTTLKRMRDSFFAYFGIRQQAVNLVNDNMIVEKTVDAERISGQDVLTAMLELNGCFGHIGRDDEFKYVFLLDDSRFGLYPRDDLYPSNDLFPLDPKSHGINRSTYITCEYEDFETKEITKIQIRKEEDDVGCIYGSGNNTYIIEDNFLVYGKSASELETIARNLLPMIANRTYRPAKVYARANPCLEVGDAIRMSTKRELVESYIFKRVLTGKQALKDTYTSEGVEEYSEKVTGRNSEIIQLKGLSNKIIHNVEENRQEMLDITNGLHSLILQTAGQIVLKVDGNGRIVQVELGIDASKGAEFKVKATNISMTAEETISFMAGGDLNLTGKNIKISSNNFSVNKNGDVVCRNITAWGISGNAVNQFSKSVDESEAMRLAKQAISAAQSAANTANSAANTAASAAATAAATAQKADELAQQADETANIAKTTVENLVNTVIPDINKAIQGVSNRVTALESKK